MKQLTHTNSHDRSAQAPPDAAGAEFNPLQWVHQLLRGRYHWAILLALVFGGLGAYLEHERVELVYDTTGEIRVRSHLPRLLHSNELSGRMPDFPAFVDSQVRLLQSERVIDMAMGTDDWRALGRPYTPETQEEFQDALRVRGSTDSGLIRVSYRDPDRAATQVAVRTVIESYQRLFHETDPTQDRRRMQLLDEHRLTLSNRLSSLRNRIRGFGDVYGPDGVRYRHRAAVSEVRSLIESIQGTERAIRRARERIEQGPPPLTLEQAAERNPRIAAMIQRVEDRRRVMAMAEDQGMERSVETHQAQIDQLQRRIEREVAEIDPTADEAAWRATLEGRIETLENERTDYQQQLEVARERLAEAESERNRLDELESEARETERALSRVESRIDSLNVESAMGDRVEILNYGRGRNRPVNEDEPMKRAMIGGMAGSGLGVGLVMIIGLLNPRLRRSEDLTAAQGAPKVLGLLPHLPERLDDPEATAYASQCIHQVRMFLQLEGGNDDVRSFVITGPVTGTGKTSLTMALGFSYAAASARTLLIDFDVSGAGLTHRLDVGRTKRLGRLLREQGLVAAEDIAQAAEDLSSHKRLGQKLVERNLIKREDIDRVLAAQAKSRVGLLDVLAGEPLDECIVELPTTNLSLLSMGNATPEHVSQVGRATVQRLLEQVHAKYDVILIDTGPVPGSIEASIVAAEADRVVVTVSRGDEMRRLNACTSFLNSIDARIAGVVYNRAGKRDMERSSYAYVGHGSSIARPSRTAETNGHQSVNGNGNGKPSEAAPPHRAAGETDPASTTKH